MESKSNLWALIHLAGRLLLMLILSTTLRHGNVVLLQASSRFRLRVQILAGVAVQLGRETFADGNSWATQGQNYLLFIFNVIYILRVNLRLPHSPNTCLYCICVMECTDDVSPLIISIFLDEWRVL